MVNLLLIVFVGINNVYFIVSASRFVCVCLLFCFCLSCSMCSFVIVVSFLLEFQ